MGSAVSADVGCSTCWNRGPRDEATPLPSAHPAGARSRVLVVGSINVDLYQKLAASAIQLNGKTVNVGAIKGMTLPAKSFVENEGIASQLSAAGLACPPGEEEALVLSMGPPFEQKTGGKGANAAAAAGQTLGCELVCQFGRASAEANATLLADLETYGKVDTSRSRTVAGPTGTAYILLFEDNDNCILLLGGANQAWEPSPVVAEGSAMRQAIAECSVVMLQREIPQYVNVEVARAARELGKPVFMDVGGTDAPLDPDLIPYISVIAPNETELTFISGVETAEGGSPSQAGVRAAVAALRARFAAAGNAAVEVLVTLGQHGCVHFGPEWAEGAAADAAGPVPHETGMGSFPLAAEGGRPRDTTGAGDCFRGSFAAARYGEGRSLREALRWASAAGSLAVEVHGAMPSMPAREAIGARAAGEPSAGLFPAPPAQKAD